MNQQNLSAILKDENKSFQDSLKFLKSKSIDIKKALSIVEIISDIFPIPEIIHTTLLICVYEQISQKDINERYKSKKDSILSFLNLKIENRFINSDKKIFLKDIFLDFIHSPEKIFFLLCERIYILRNIELYASTIQLDIARETIEVLLPLAVKSGAFILKEELENRAFQLLYPQDAKNIKQQMTEILDLRSPIIQTFEEIFQKDMENKKINGIVYGRHKSYYSIFKKLYEKGKTTVSSVYDIFAIRIIVDDINECYQVLGIVHEHGIPIKGRIKDYIADPKKNGYQSIHTTILVTIGEEDPFPIEVQIRTKEMHINAEKGIASHLLYKFQEIEIKNIFLDEYYSKNKVTQHQNHIKKARTISDNIFVFTIGNRIKSLPKGSTPLDFAFAIHNQIGEKCIGAKINGENVPLNTPLQNSDIVEIITDDDAKPKKEWLNYVKTLYARHCIKKSITEKK